MATFKYKAFNVNNSIIESDLRANDIEEARQAIVDRGYVPIKIDEVKGISSLTIDLNFFKKVKMQDVIIFCKQLAIISKTGIGLVVGLNILKNQSTKTLKSTIQSINAEVQKGRTLAEAMEEGEYKFPELLIKMISTGEASGKLDSVLSNMADYYERESYIKQKIKGAMSYPSIMVIVSIGLMVFFSKYILPELTNIMEGQKMPPITEFTLKAIDMVQSPYILIVIGIIVAALVMIKKLMPEKQYKNMTDSIILLIPAIGPVVRILVMLRFTRTLYLLLSSGLDIVGGLDVMRKIISHSIAEDTIVASLESIKRGDKLAHGLDSTNFFDPLIVQMIGVGEETGELETILDELSKFYERKLELKIEKLVSLVEPVFTLVIGLLIGFVVIAIAMPIFGMAGALGNSE